jgi:hypothetical protein
MAQNAPALNSRIRACRASLDESGDKLRRISSFEEITKGAFLALFLQL